MHKNYDQDPNTWLYPDIEPYRTGRLQVSEVHDLYFEESGNPNGKPVLFIHGGPGGGTGPTDRRYFHPEKYRIILFDQRGSGNSKPMASLVENTTWDLVNDIEKLRSHLGIEQWNIFGGSWGSTLALAYAITHPTKVTSLTLRGIFLLRKKEIDWYYQEGLGANTIYPDVWEKYRDHIPAAERGDMLKAYYSRLTHSDSKIQIAAAKPWTTWEIATSRLYTSPEIISSTVTDDFALRFARIECHYFIHKGFFSSDQWIIENIDQIRTIPTIIVQGRYDVVCPTMSAWELHKAWPEAKLNIIPDAGHSSREPGIAKALVHATDLFAEKN